MKKQQKTKNNEKTTENKKTMKKQQKTKNNEKTTENPISMFIR